MQFVIATLRGLRGRLWADRAEQGTERVANKTYRSRNQAHADVFDYIERFYNPRRRHSTLGYLSPIDFEEQARLA